MITRPNGNRLLQHPLRGPLAILIFLLLPLVAAPATAQTLYVTDRIVADLYTQPNAVGTPAARLPTGTAVQLLARRNGFVRVRTPENHEGWVSSRLLQAEVPAQVALMVLGEQQQYATTELERARRQLAQYRNAAGNARQVSSSWWMFAALLAALLAGFVIGVVWLDGRRRGRHGGFRV